MTLEPKSATPILRTISVSGRRNGSLRTDVDVRSFKFIIDEPEKLGGKNEAPTPMEYVTGALGGCFNVTIELVAKEADLLLTDVEINCKGTVDHRGLFGTADVTPHFQEVRVDISLKLVISEDQRQSFEQTCLNRCPVYNLIKDSGAPIKVNWNYQ